jgi:hypothetical protein
MRIGVADQVKKFWAPGRDKSMWILCAVFIGVFGLKHGSVFAGMAVARWLRA